MIAHSLCLANSGIVKCTGTQFFLFDGEEVHTVATDTVATSMGTETAPVASWVSWCLPRHLAAMAAMAGFSMAVGSSTEGQKTTRKPDKLAVYKSLREYMGSG